MANQGHDMSFATGQGQDMSFATGQGQMKESQFMNQQASHPSHDSINRAYGTSPQATHNNTYTAQATNFIHQTGEQVMNMAQGAAEAVKNTLGMGTEGNNPPHHTTSTTNHPSTTTHSTTTTTTRSSNTNHPSNPSTRI